MLPFNRCNRSLINESQSRVSRVLDVIIGNLIRPHIVRGVGGKFDRLINPACCFVRVVKSPASSAKSGQPNAGRNRIFLNSQNECPFLKVWIDCSKTAGATVVGRPGTYLSAESAQLSMGAVS